MGEIMTNLNLVKPITTAQKRIAQKCKWADYDDIPVRKNLLPDGFVGKAKLEPNIPTIGYPLNKNNFVILEKVLGNDKLSKSPFVRSNMTELLENCSSEKGAKLFERILTPENIDKLDYQRTLIRNNPRAYLKDKSDANYMNTPAGLTALFHDVNLLKAAAVLDKEALNALFKKDITQGAGKSLVENIGKMNLEQIEKVQKDFELAPNTNPISKIYYAAFGKNNVV